MRQAPDMESSTAQEVVAWALERFPGKVALACSFQKEETVLLDMLFALDDIIFEAPTKASQAWFVKQFGPNVNLGNIPPDEVIPLATLRFGLRGDTLKEVLLGERAGTVAP